MFKLDDANLPDLGPYIYFADTSLNLISVFDDLNYDRSDVDAVGPGMRKHAVKKLSILGFSQKSGSILEHTSGVRCYFPKFRALGASPFSAITDLDKKEEDFYILTPTQTACCFIDYYDLEEAVDRIKTLIQQQPINIKKLNDFLEPKPQHENFKQAIGHLKYIQRLALESEQLKNLRSLR